MKRFLKRSISILLVAVMLFGTAPLAGFVGLELPELNLFRTKAEAAETSGICGDNLTWTFDELTGTLTISGEGEMYNYNSYDNLAPWHLNGIYSVTIEDGVTSIGDYAFYRSYDLTDVTIPDSVTQIGKGAFYSCKSITKLTISEYITEIGEGAFTDVLIKLLEYNAPSGLLLSAFSNPKFDEVKIGPKVKNAIVYGEQAEYPRNISAFVVCVLAKKITVDPENKYFSTDEYGVLFNKNKTELIAYPSRSENTEYTVPDSVKTICFTAFRGSVNLKKIDLSNVEEIQATAFVGCKNLADFKIPDTVKKVGSMAFQDTARYDNALSAFEGSSETEIYFENHLIYYNCDETITSYDIRPGTITVGGMSFFNIMHLNLETVTVPESVLYLGFDSITSPIKQIIIHPDNPYFNNGEDGAVYSEDMSVLVSYPAFSDKAEKFTIPPSVSVIGPCAFMGAENIKEIELSSTVKEIKPVAFADSGITSFKIPKGIEKICYATFLFCSNLTTLYIPESVKYIGMMAIEHCENLTDVYFEGTEEEWNEILIEGENYSLEEATIHFNCDYHTHKYTKTVTQEATCTENGSATYICECGETYIEVIPACHVATTITVPATCKATGMSYDVCVNCGASIGNVKIIPKTDHTPGEWETVVEATTETEGKKVKKCKVCDIVLEEKIIPKLAVIIDNDTGVVIEYNPDNYEGTPKLNVDETFDEIAIQILNLKTGAVSEQIFNITMTLDGVEIQPNGYITIRIPVPEGFDKNYIHIYYINSQTEEAEKLDSRIEGDYIVFETNHFSYYAVAQVCDSSVSIKNPSTTMISYGDSIVLHADVESIPEGGYVEWTSSNGNFTYSVSDDGSTCTISPSKSGDTTFTATVYDANGNEVCKDEQTMTSKAGFFQKIFAFFKKLFGATKVIPEAIRLR